MTHSCLLSALAGLWIWCSSAAAQCPVPDGLDGGPCCFDCPTEQCPATPSFPDLPGFDQPSLQICWRACGVDAAVPCRAVWSSLSVPAESTGGERQATLDIRSPAGVLQWTGELTLQYARSWLETDPGGGTLQVWRFLVNGDMQPVAAAPAGSQGKKTFCPVPPCAALHANLVRFTGYVDYAASCSGVPSVYQHAWMLTHALDAIDHHAGFPRAGTFHPDRAFTFVGPRAGFVPGPIQPTEGTPGATSESMRRLDTWSDPLSWEFEEQLTFALQPAQQACLSGTASDPLQYLIGDLTIESDCFNSVFESGNPLLPGFVSMGIGSWTLAGAYPGVESLRWNVSNNDRTNVSCPIFLPTFFPEVYFGVTTVGGYPATQLTAGGPGAALPLTFIDQSNAYPMMNVPYDYVSDHFLSLNH